MSKKPGLPAITDTGNTMLDTFCQNAKAILDTITGQARNVKRLDPLPADATLEEVIARVNEVTERMQ